MSTEAYHWTTFSQLNTIYTFTTHFSTIHFTVIVPSTPVPQVDLPLRIWNWNLVCSSCFSLMHYLSSPTNHYKSRFIYWQYTTQIT